MGGVTVEDGSWMRNNDFQHINVAKLEAVLKGINLCIKWNLKDIVFIVDSVTVYRWVNLILTGGKRIKTTGAAEIFVERSLVILNSLIDEFGLKIPVTLLKSEQNKADVFTIIRKKWYTVENQLGCIAL